MSGILVGQLILWLIVAIIAIVIVVYIVNWLYHRSSKEVSFVRTGFLGERVVINGGAFVLPFIHDYTPVNMNVLPMGITRARQDAVITRDRMRVDIEADFYVRVQPTRDAVSIAAATLGRRTLEPEQLHALLSGKFVSAIRSVAAEMTMEQMHEQRGEYVARVKAAAAEALQTLDHQGLDGQLGDGGQIFEVGGEGVRERQFDTNERVQRDGCGRFGWHERDSSTLILQRASRKALPRCERGRGVRRECRPFGSLQMGHMAKRQQLHYRTRVKSLR